MENFANILKELIVDNNIDKQQLATNVGVTRSTINRWLSGKMSIYLSTAIRLANVFNCSLDYLFGRSLNFGNGNFKPCPPLNEQLRKILKELNITQNSLLKNKIINTKNIDNWFGKGRDAQIESMIKLADYLDVSLDYLVGREK